VEGDKVEIPTPLGVTTVPERTRPLSDFASLLSLIKEQGLLRRSTSHTVVALSVNVAMWAVAWSAFFIWGHSYQFLVAVLFAFVTVQSGFIEHDAGHGQLHRSRRVNDLVGFVQGNLLLGMSYGWWVRQHNRHHSTPNCIDRDPAISIATLAFTPDQARQKRGVARFIARNQVYLFYPMLLLEGLYILGQGARGVLLRRVRHPLREGLLISIHFVVYAGVLVSTLGAARAALFAALYLGVSGLYLGSVFAPNHKGMPLLYQGEEVDYLRRQVVTSRNVRGHPLTDLLFGGLNYQIEHHLFPRMPRRNLRRAQPIVRAFCMQRGIPYHETTLSGSIGEILRHLHQVSAPLREPRGKPRDDRGSPGGFGGALPEGNQTYLSRKQTD
jgi:fatty acid desaturase